MRIQRVAGSSQGPRGDAVERMQHTADYRQGMGAFLKLLTDENVGRSGKEGGDCSGRV